MNPSCRDGLLLKGRCIQPAPFRRKNIYPVKKAGGKAAPQAVYGPSGMTETLFITRADGGFRGILPMMTRGTIIAFSAAVLAALALVAVLSDSSEAETIDIDGGQYELDTVEHEATLVAVDAFLGDFYIPAFISDGTDTYPVTAIGPGAIPRNLYELIIGQNIEEIDEDAFVNANLVEFSVDPDNENYEVHMSALYTADWTLLAYPVGNTRSEYSVVDETVAIAPKAFQFADSLTNIEFPESLTQIGDYAFRNCAALTDADLPESVTDVGVGIFSNCHSLTKLPKMPSSVIYDSTFSGCIGLKEIVIDESIIAVGPSAFANCKAISYLSVHEGCTVDDTAFQGLTVLDPSGNPVTGSALRGNLYYGSGIDKKLYDSTTGFTIHFSAGVRECSSTIMTTVGGRLPSLPTYTGLLWDLDTWYLRDGTQITTETVFTSDDTVYTSGELPDADPLDDNLIIGGVVIALMVGFVICIIATAKRF